MQFQQREMIPEDMRPNMAHGAYKVCAARASGVHRVHSQTANMPSKAVLCESAVGGSVWGFEPGLCSVWGTGEELVPSQAHTPARSGPRPQAHTHGQAHAHVRVQAHPRGTR